MDKQFVLMDPTGTEIEWVDPVTSFEEDEDSWTVNNGYFTYEFHKKDYPGCTMGFKVAEYVWREES